MTRRASARGLPAVRAEMSHESLIAASKPVSPVAARAAGAISTLILRLILAVAAMRSLVLGAAAPMTMPEPISMGHAISGYDMNGGMANQGIGVDVQPTHVHDDPMRASSPTSSLISWPPGPLATLLLAPRISRYDVTARTS